MHCFGNIYKIRWVLCESFAIETRLIHLKDDSYSPSSSPFSVDARFTRRMQTHFSTQLKKEKGEKKRKKKKQSEIWCVKLPFRCSQMAIFTLPCHCKVGESPGAWSWEGEPVLLKTNRAQNIPHSFVQALSPTILHVCEYKKETTTQKGGCANDLQVSRVRKGPNRTVVYSFLLCPPLGDRNCFTPLPPWIETLLRTW